MSSLERSYARAPFQPRFANSGYIPDDASFDANTFQVLSSRLKPGCAETAINGGLMDLILANDK